MGEYLRNRHSRQLYLYRKTIWYQYHENRTAIEIFRYKSLVFKNDILCWINNGGNTRRHNVGFEQEFLDKLPDRRWYKPRCVCELNSSLPSDYLLHVFLFLLESLVRKICRFTRDTNYSRFSDILLDRYRSSVWIASISIVKYSEQLYIP